MRILLIIACLAMLISCKKEKDPCEDIACLNGGVCVTGTCNCPVGYSGPRCEIFNPCASVTCLNGGTCANGTCNCPTGYSGSDCSLVLTPSSVKITKITLTQYPMTTTSGGGWDALAGNGPDVFITLNPGTTATLNNYVSGTGDNVTGQTLYVNNLNLTLINPSSNYTIGVWDEDTAANEFMCGLYFTPNAFSGGFPPTITLQTSLMRVVLDVTWQF